MDTLYTHLLKEVVELKDAVGKSQEELGIYKILAVTLPILTSFITYLFTLHLTKINNERLDNRQQRQFAEERRRRIDVVVNNISASVELLAKQARQIETHKLFLAHAKRVFDLEPDNDAAKDEIVYHRNIEAEYLWEFHKTQSKLQEHVSDYFRLFEPPACFFAAYKALKDCVIPKFDFSSSTANILENNVANELEKMDARYNNESFGFLGTHLMRCITKNTPRE